MLRPDGRNVKLVVVFDGVHVFVYRWGVTIRHRRLGGGWRHWAARMRAGTHSETRKVHAIIGVETWRTTKGTYERVPFTKRYVNVKILL